jgi:hypothetical protein
MEKTVLVIDREWFFICFDNIAEAQQWAKEKCGFSNWRFFDNIVECCHNGREAIIGAEKDVMNYVRHNVSANEPIKVGEI